MLKVFSDLLDENCFDPLTRSILDAGSGVGVLGICAAGALAEKGYDELRVRAQDRDELTRVFTLYNAAQNGIDEKTISAHIEPLLADCGPFDLILTNIPAKAGKPVLEDFIPRSVRCLSSGGKALMVAVNTLADFFTETINEKAALLRTVKGSGHTVFLYGKNETRLPPKNENSKKYETGNLLEWNPSYMRCSVDLEMEKIPYKMKTVHGAENFDSAGGETEAAAKLAIRLEKEVRSCAAPERILIWEDDQGHFAAWFEKHFTPVDMQFVLAGRNVLALEASLLNLRAAMVMIMSAESLPEHSIITVNAADLGLESEKILAGGQCFSFIAAFPKKVPQTNTTEAFWESLKRISLPGAIILIGLPSTEAESFDRKKPKGFTRLGDLKRKGFRALAYRLTK